MRPVTKTEFAKEREVSRARVYQWIGDGRVQVLEDGRIDAEAAHAALDASLDKTKGIRRDGNLTSEAPGGAAPQLPEIAQGQKPKENEGYWADKAREQAAVATLAEMRALKEAGALVPAAGVRKAAAESARSVRNAMLAIPDRISPVLDPGNPARAHKLLTDEIQKVLRELSTGLDERAAESAGAG